MHDAMLALRSVPRITGARRRDGIEPVGFLAHALAAIFLVVAPSVAQAPHEHDHGGRAGRVVSVGEVDGRSHPELIPEEIAYRHFCGLLAAKPGVAAGCGGSP